MTLTAGSRAALLRRNKQTNASSAPSSSSSARTGQEQAQMGASSSSARAAAVDSDGHDARSTPRKGAPSSSAAKGNADSPSTAPASSSSGGGSKGLRRITQPSARRGPTASSSSSSAKPEPCSDGYQATTFSYASKREKRLRRRQEEQERTRLIRQDEERRRMLREVEQEHHRRWHEAQVHSDCSEAGHAVMADSARRMRELQGARPYPIEQGGGVAPEPSAHSSPNPTDSPFGQALPPFLQFGTSDCDSGTAVVYAGPHDGGVGTFVWTRRREDDDTGALSSEPPSQAEGEAQRRREEEATHELLSAATAVGANQWFPSGLTSMFLQRRLFSARGEAEPEERETPPVPAPTPSDPTVSANREHVSADAPARTSPTPAAIAKKKRKSKSKNKRRKGMGKAAAGQDEGEGDGDEHGLATSSSLPPTSPTKPNAGSASMPSSPPRRPTTDDILSETLRSPIMAPLSRLRIPDSDSSRSATRASGGGRRSLIELATVSDVNEELEFGGAFTDGSGSTPPQVTAASSPSEAMQPSKQTTQTWRVSSAGTESSSYHTAHGVSSAEETTEAGGSPDLTRREVSRTLVHSEGSYEAEATLAVSHDEPSSAPSVRSVTAEPGSVATSTIWAGFTTSDSRDTAASNLTTTSITSAQSELAALHSHQTTSVKLGDEGLTSSPQGRGSEESSPSQKETPPAPHQSTFSTPQPRRGQGKASIAPSPPARHPRDASLQGLRHSAMPSRPIRACRSSSPAPASPRSPQSRTSSPPRRVASAPMAQAPSPHEATSSASQRPNAPSPRLPLPPTELGLSQAVCSSSSDASVHDSALSEGHVEARGRKQVGRQETLERTRMWTAKGPYQAPSEGQQEEVEASLDGSSGSIIEHHPAPPRLKDRRGGPDLQLQMGGHDLSSSSGEQPLPSSSPRLHQMPPAATSRSRSTSGGSIGVGPLHGLYASSEPNSISFVLSPRSMASAASGSEVVPFARPRETAQTLESPFTPAQRRRRVNFQRSSSLGAIPKLEDGTTPPLLSPDTTRDVGDSSGTALTGSPSAPLTKSGVRALLKRMPNFEALYPPRSAARRERLKRCAWLGIEDRIRPRTRWNMEVASMKRRVEAAQARAAARERRDFAQIKDEVRLWLQPSEAHTGCYGCASQPQGSGTFHDSRDRRSELVFGRASASASPPQGFFQRDDGTNSRSGQPGARCDSLGPVSSPSRDPLAGTSFYPNNVGEALARAAAAGLIGDQSFMSTSTMGPDEQRRDLIMLRREIKQWTDRPWMKQMRHIDDEEKRKIARFLDAGLEEGAWWLEDDEGKRIRPEYTTPYEFETRRAADAAHHHQHPHTWDPSPQGSEWWQPDPHALSDGASPSSAAAILASGNIELEHLAQHRIEAYRSRSSERRDESNWNRPQAYQPGHYSMRSQSQSPSWERRKERASEANRIPLSSSYHEGFTNHARGLGLQCIDEFADAASAQDLFDASSIPSDGEVGLVGPSEHDETMTGPSGTAALRRQSQAADDLCNLSTYSCDFDAAHGATGPLHGWRGAAAGNVGGPSSSSHGSGGIAEVQPRLAESQLPELDQLIHVHQHNLHAQRFHYSSSQSGRRDGGPQRDSGSELPAGQQGCWRPQPSDKQSSPPPQHGHHQQHAQATHRIDVEEEARRPQHEQQRQYWPASTAGGGCGASAPPSLVSSPTDARPGMEGGGYADTASGPTTPWQPLISLQHTTHPPHPGMFSPSAGLPMLPAAAATYAEWERMRMEMPPPAPPPPQLWSGAPPPSPAALSEVGLPAGFGFVECFAQTQMMHQQAVLQAHFNHNLMAQTQLQQQQIQQQRRLERLEHFAAAATVVQEQEMGRRARSSTSSEMARNEVPRVQEVENEKPTKHRPPRLALQPLLAASSSSYAGHSAIPSSYAGQSGPSSSYAGQSAPSSSHAGHTNPHRRSTRPPIPLPPASWEEAGLPPVPRFGTLPSQDARVYEGMSGGGSYRHDALSMRHQREFGGPRYGSSASRGKPPWRPAGFHQQQRNNRPPVSSSERSYRTDRKPFRPPHGAIWSSESAPPDAAGGSQDQAWDRRSMSGAVAAARPSDDARVTAAAQSSSISASGGERSSNNEEAEPQPTQVPLPASSSPPPGDSTLTAINASPVASPNRLPADSAWVIPLAPRKQREMEAAAAAAAHASSSSSSSVPTSPQRRRASSGAASSRSFPMYSPDRRSSAVEPVNEKGKGVDRGNEIVPGAGRTRRKQSSAGASSSSGAASRR